MTILNNDRIRKSYLNGLRLLRKQGSSPREAVPEPFQSNVKSLLILLTVVISGASEHDSEEELAQDIALIGEALFAEGYEACLTEHFNTSTQKKTPTKVGE